MVSAAFTCLLKYCVEIMYKYGLSVILVKKIKVCKTNITLPGPKGAREIEIGREIEK